MKIADIQKQFKKEKGIAWVNSQGEPDIEYVQWLEDKVLFASHAKTEQPTGETDERWKEFEHDCFMNCKMETYDHGNLRKAIFRWMKENYQLPNKK